MNVARIAALRAGLPDSVPAVTVNRFCSSGSQTIAMAAERIMAGMADSIIAGGTESMSLVARQQQVPPEPVSRREPSRGLPEHGLDRGERGAQVQGLARGRRRVRATAATRRALAAQAGREVRRRRDRAAGSRDRRAPDETEQTSCTIRQGRGPARGYDAGGAGEAGAGRFHAKDVVTAGNSSQTSDGAAGGGRDVERSSGRAGTEAAGDASSPSPSAACRRRSWAWVRLWRCRRRSSSRA